MNRNPCATSHSGNALRTGDPPRLKRDQQNWDENREIITSLYKSRNSTLNDMMKTMEQQYGFVASRKQYLERINKWGLFKNIKAFEYDAMIRIEARRRSQGREKTAFTIRSRKVPQDKIERYKKRKSAGSAQEPSSPVDAPTPTDIEYCTPGASRPESPVAESFQADDNLPPGFASTNTATNLTQWRRHSGAVRPPVVLAGSATCPDTAFSEPGPLLSNRVPGALSFAGVFPQATARFGNAGMVPATSTSEALASATWSPIEDPVFWNTIGAGFDMSHPAPVRGGVSLPQALDNDLINDLNNERGTAWRDGTSRAAGDFSSAQEMNSAGVQESGEAGGRLERTTSSEKGPAPALNREDTDEVLWARILEKMGNFEPAEIIRARPSTADPEYARDAFGRFGEIPD